MTTDHATDPPTAADAQSRRDPFRPVASSPPEQQDRPDAFEHFASALQPVIAAGFVFVHAVELTIWCWVLGAWCPVQGGAL